MPRASSIIIALLVMVSAAGADTVLVSTNNYNDLNPARDAHTVLSDNLRLTHYVTDGAAAFDLSGATSAVLTVQYTTGGWTQGTYQAESYDIAGVVRWYVPQLPAGTYQFSGVAQFPSFTRQVYLRNWTLTNAPSGEITASVTVNVITTGEVAVTTSGSGTVVTGVVALGKSDIEVQYGTVAGGGGGDVYLSSNNAFTGIANWSANDGMNNLAFAYTTNSYVFINDTSNVQPQLEKAWPSVVVRTEGERSANNTVGAIPLAFVDDDEDGSYGVFSGFREKTATTVTRSALVISPSLAAGSSTDWTRLYATRGNEATEHVAMWMLREDAFGPIFQVGFFDNNLTTNTSAVVDAIPLRIIRGASASMTDGRFAINEDQRDLDFNYESISRTGLIWGDATLGRVGINDLTPSYDFDVLGDVQVQSNAFVRGNLWLGTNAYLAVDSTTTNLLWITVTPPTTNLIGVTTPL